MSIFEYIQDHPSKKQFKETQEKAEKMFKMQRDRIREIRETEGYKEIKKFWNIEKEAATQRLISSKTDDATARAMFALADKFLKFLDVRDKD